MRRQFLTFLALFAATANIIEARRPCRANRPTTENTTPATEVTTKDPKAPCMAAWENIKAEDDAFADYAMTSSSSASAVECGKTCEADIKCAYSFFKTDKCMTFERFIPTDFLTNGDMTLIFKLYLNGTTTCDTATIEGLSTSKEKMYYPDGGSYWLFKNVMDTIGYGSYNPALGYKRRKRSILGWLLNY